MYGFAVMLSVPALTTGKNIDKMGGIPFRKQYLFQTQSVPSNSFQEKQPFLHHRMMKGFKSEKHVNNYLKSSTKYILVTFYYM